MDSLTSQMRPHRRLTSKYYTQVFLFNYCYILSVLRTPKPSLVPVQSQPCYSGKNNADHIVSDVQVSQTPNRYSYQVRR